MEHHLTVLYVAEEPTRLPGTLAARGWEVYRATTAEDALAMLVYYEPHITIVDGDTPMTRQALWHMVSVSGPSAHIVDVIVALSDDDLTYEPPAYILLRKLPTNTAPQDLLAQLPKLLAEQEDEVSRLMADHHSLSHITF
jgi:hypothetical protein